MPGAETAVADVRDAEALSAAIDDLAAPAAGSTWPSPTRASPRAGRCGWSGPRRSRRRSTSTCSASGAPSRAAMPHVLARRGHLLLVASAAAVLPTAGLGAYSASKAGVEALGRSLRVELRAARRECRRRLLPVPEHADGRRRRRLADLRATKSRLPAPLAKTWPLEPAVARTVRAIERRSRAVAHPAVPARADGRARPARQPAAGPRGGGRDAVDGGGVLGGGRARGRGGGRARRGRPVIARVRRRRSSASRPSAAAGWAWSTRRSRRRSAAPSR